MTEKYKEVEISRCKELDHVYMHLVEFNHYYYSYLKGYNNVPNDCKSNLDYQKIQEKMQNLKYSVVRASSNDSKYQKIENKPFKVQLVGGQKDYKDRSCLFVKNEQDVCHVMYIDIFLEAFFNSGIDEDGWFRDEFVFASYGNEVKLIRNNSNLHEAIKFYSTNNTQKIKSDDLEVGRIYKTRTGKKAVFLGYVTTVYYKRNKEEAVESQTIGKAGLWMDVHRYINIQNSLNDYSYKRISLSHSYTIKTGEKIDIQNGDHVNKIADSAFRKLKEISANNKKNRYNYVTWVESIFSYMDLVKLANMCMYGFHASFNDKTEKLFEFFPDLHLENKEK